MWQPGPPGEGGNFMHGSYASSPVAHAKFPASAPDHTRRATSVEESEVLKAVQEMDRGTAWEASQQQYHHQQQFQQYPQPQQKQVVFQQPQQHVIHYQQQQQQQVHYQQPGPVQHIQQPAMRQPAAQPWQPSSAEAQIFHYQNTQGDPKEVQWPPADDAQFHERQQGPGAPMTMPLRREIPLQQEPVPVVRTVPRATTPFRVTKWRGDEKWPPEHTRQKPEEAKETVRPAKPNKDYMPFFDAHKLPANYPGYRAPPGTQFIGIDGVEPGYYYDQMQQPPQ